MTDDTNQGNEKTYLYAQGNDNLKLYITRYLNGMTPNTFNSKCQLCPWESGNTSKFDANERSIVHLKEEHEID